MRYVDMGVSMSIWKGAVLGVGFSTCLLLPVQAGGLDEVRIEPEVMAPTAIAEETEGEGRGQEWVIPLIILTIIGAIASS